MKLKNVNTWEGRITLTDLCDTDFVFKCQHENKMYFDFCLTAKVNDYHYYQSLSENDLETLQRNCRKILEATEGLK